MATYDTQGAFNVTGRDAVFYAAEMLAASLYALNAAGDGTDRAYRDFAAQYKTETPFGCVATALRKMYAMLAAIDGFTAPEAEAIAGNAVFTMYDLTGEDSPATRAYTLAVETLRADRAEALEAVAADCQHTVRRVSIGTLGCGYGCAIDQCEQCGAYLPQHSAERGCPDGARD
jgi:hypothetical protein